MDIGSSDSLSSCENAPELSKFSPVQDKPIESSFSLDMMVANKARLEEEIQMLNNKMMLINTNADLLAHKFGPKLPDLTIPKFDGDPKMYHMFMKYFNRLVLERPISDDEKILYLIHYCEGKAKEAVTCYQRLESTEALKEALNNLKQRFGRVDLTASSLVEELLQWPSMHKVDGDSLVCLAEHMKACEKMLSDLDCTEDLNASHTIKTIASKLPPVLQDKWISYLVKTVDGRKPKFNDLQSFLDKIAKRYTLKTQFLNSVSPVENYIHVKGEPLKCVLCSMSHYLDKCTKFLNLSVDDRYQFARAKKLCYFCLKSNHLTSDCRRRLADGHTKIKYHYLLISGRDENNSVQPEASKATKTNCTKQRKDISLPIVPLRVRCDKKVEQTCALLDTASDTTFIGKDLADRLGARGELSELTIQTLNGAKTTSSKRVGIDLLPLNEDQAIKVPDACTIDEFPVSVGNGNLCVDTSQYEYLRDLPLPKTEQNKVELLIGCDVPEAHTILEQRAGKLDEPTAIKTKFGWTLFGPNKGVNVSHPIHCSTRDIEDMFLKLYNQDYMDEYPDRKGSSVDDKLASDVMNESIKLRNGHYEIALPWKPIKSRLGSNYWQANKRLEHLKAKLTKNKILHEKYTETVEKYIREGHAKAVAPGLEHQGWYLPHHAVLSPSKPGKVRVVFDCAARHGGICLNDTLFSGPDLNNSLFGVLLRFRRFPVAVTADIEAMFHQVNVPERDRNYLKFLWWPEGRLDQEPATFCMTVHLFGATSSPSCATMALRRTVSDNTHLFDGESIRVANEQFYVDDLLMSTNTVDEAVKLAENLKHLMQLGGFNLTKWNSNVPEVLNNIGAPNNVDSQNMDLESKGNNKALGVKWNLSDDCFHFEANADKSPVSKRNMLSIVASIYDPLGLLCPVLLTGKVLLQEAHREKLGWDEPINGELLKRWNNWVNDLSNIKTLKVPRCIRPDDVQTPYSLELHCFSDASEYAYGAAVYARFLDNDQRVYCTLLGSKSRVAPLKPTTIPRLELMAAVLCAKLGKQIELELKTPIASTTFWTDSSVTLNYIRNTSRRFDIFVSHRVAAIHAHSNANQWRYVSTKENPADLASRGMAPNDPKRLTMWLGGPSFLSRPNDEWSELEPLTAPQNDVLSVRTNLILREEDTLKCLSGLDTWSKVQRVLGWCQRFYNNVRLKTKNQPLVRGHLSVAELRHSKYTILQAVQRSAFLDELNKLKSTSLDYEPFVRADEPVVILEDICGRHHSRDECYVDPRIITKSMRTELMKSSHIKGLKPFVCDGLLRVGGRLTNAPIPFETKHPVILPKDHFITRLIIRDCHLRNGHAGVNYLMSRLREEYWIISCHSTVLKEIRRCFECKRMFARPCNQLMSSLPAERVEPDSRPFKYVGIDYFGPFYIRTGRKQEKRYGCLFTCLVTRAVHIEVAHTLSADSFICAFSRFTARRGYPQKVYSDNGSNFKGAETDLKSILRSWNKDEIARIISDNGCDWVFNPPKASHRGGAWERIIGLIKRILTALLHKDTLTEETLTTFLVKVESILNNRPLTKMISEDSELVALSPNMLLLPYHDSSALTNVPFEEAAARKLREAQRCCQEFWRRFKLEYLPILQKRSKWLKYERNLKVGDLVLLVDKDKSRRTWKLGVISCVNQSSDGCVRKVLLKTVDGVIERDVRSLCLLERSEENSSGSVHGGEC